MTKRITFTTIRTVTLCVLSAWLLAGCGGTNQWDNTTEPTDTTNQQQQNSPQADWLRVWDQVLISYEITLADNGAILSPTDIKPVTIVLGEASFGAKVDDELMTMKVGDTRTIRLSPEEWNAGEYNPNNIKRFPQALYQQIGVDLAVGDTQYFDGVPAIVVEIETDREEPQIVFDMNNPRTYKDTIMTITLEEIK